MKMKRPIQEKFFQVLNELPLKKEMSNRINIKYGHLQTGVFNDMPISSTPECIAYSSHSNIKDEQIYLVELQLNKNEKDIANNLKFYMQKRLWGEGNLKSGLLTCLNGRTIKATDLSVQQIVEIINKSVETFRSIIHLADDPELNGIYNAYNNHINAANVLSERFDETVKKLKIINDMS